MAEVIYPDVNSLWDALTADWGVAGSYGLLLETYLTASVAAVVTALGAEFDGTPDIYDVLVAGGIPVWPAAADPANNISMAQVIRQIFDNLVTADGIIDNIIIATDRLTGADVGGTHTYLDAGGEQTLFTIATAVRLKIHGILIDLTALTQDTTIIVRTIIGLAMVEIDRIEWTQGVDAVGVYFAENLAITQNMEVTMEEGADEGANRDVPYSYITEAME